ncbi:hypothetical protein C475_21374 [Halosimplex carlsbadense 2-9-1]|uniref:DUF6788 domain-containing protein n=1 Tax=Halosimplex carlsbadense 2-9-1 TaxID=797114 RepID=M0C9D4_9EURY|nr:DUF6788 family protein [Halosimplex carlsbadense]ELZ19891.1 hypothetical protein C475_21374 [Halosimplex carlsbadense 2-9-1]
MPDDVSAPAALPKYLAEGLPKQDVSTLEATSEFVDALIAEKERPVETEDIPDDAEVIDDEADGYVVEELVRCGKDGCRCASGAESDMHGPYEYRYYRDDDGTLRKEYVDNR